jgi:replicative DNA helicase
MSPLSFAPDTLPEPQAVAAEVALLGIILLHPSVLDEIDGLAPGDFYASEHGHIFAAMQALWAEQTSPDLITLSNRLQQSRKLDDVGGRKRIADLMDSAPVLPTGWQTYAALIQETSLARRMAKAGHQIHHLAHSQAAPIADRIDQAQQLVYDLSDGAQEEAKAEHISDVLSRVMARLDEGKPQGLRGDSFLGLNALTGGIFPGHLMVAAGSTGTGKTHFGLAMALDYASRVPVLFISCEMTAEEITDRALARLSGVDSDRISNGSLTRQEWDALGLALGTLSAMRLHIYSTSNPSPAQIRAEIRRVTRVEGETPRLVVLDYLQLLRGDGQTRVDDLDRITMACKDIATDFKISFLALAQISRDFKNRSNKRPMVQDIRDCGAIENHANRIYLLYRDEVHNRDTADHGIIEIDVAKNRGGKTGVIRMLLDPARSWFGDIGGGDDY